MDTIKPKAINPTRARRAAKTAKREPKAAKALQATVAAQTPKRVLRAPPPGKAFVVPASNRGNTYRELETKPIDLEDYTRTVNPYYASLRDPVNSKNARIPDMMTTPSSTFTIVKKGEFLASTGDGTAAVTFGGSYIPGGTTHPYGLCQTMLVPTKTLENVVSDTPGTVTGFNSYVCGALSGPGALADDLFRVDAVPLAFDGWETKDGTIPGTFSKVRLVSAVLTVAPTGNALNSSGRMIGVSLSRCETLGAPAITVSDLENKPGAQSVYVNASKAINVFYAPTDPLSWTYADQTNTGADGDGGTLTMTSGGALDLISTGPAVNYIVPKGGENTVEDLYPYSPGELWVVIAGAEASQPFQYIVTANYEAIPRQAQTMLVPTHVSHADPIAAATALNYVATAPKVMQGNANLTPTTPAPLQQHYQAPKTPMIDRIMATIGRVARVGAKAALPVLGGLL